MLDEVKEEGGAHAAGSAAPAPAPAAAADEKQSPNKKKATFSAFSKVKAARTEDYADDSNLYIPRVNRDDRLQYYNQLVQNNKVPYVLPSKDFDGWVNQNSVTERMLEQYAARLKTMLRFITSPNWDYCYIYGFMLWALLTAVVVDGFVPASLGFTYQSPIVLLPIVVMLLSQICPTFGSLLLIRNCNDLTRQLAQIDFISWSLVSVMLMQYMERFYYGGVHRSDKAGHVAGMVGRVSWFQIFKVVVLGRKWTPPKIHPEFQLQPVGDTALVAVEEGKEGEDDEGNGGDDGDGADEESDMKGAAKSVLSIEEVSKAADTVSEQKSGETGDDSEGSDGEEMGYLAQLRRKREKELAEQKKRELEDRLALEATVADWTEWKCVCCGRQNRRPSVMPVTFDIKFGSKGVYYKRHYAKLKQKSTKPDCLHCFTPCDYVPPLSTAHYFTNNAKKGVAFEKYPKVTTLHPGLKTDKTSLYKSTAYRFFFGIDNDQSSLLLANDWRLPKYLATIFPQVPRYEKPPEEYFEIGEFVESKYQKVDWSRCIIRNVHSNHTYDIRFNTGDEIRFVYEVNLRCPPLKGKYAYRTEVRLKTSTLILLCMLVIMRFCIVGDDSDVSNVSRHSAGSCCSCASTSVCRPVPGIYRVDCYEI
jgi:hypothetical protein